MVRAPSQLFVYRTLSWLSTEVNKTWRFGNMLHARLVPGCRLRVPINEHVREWLGYRDDSVFNRWRQFPHFFFNKKLKNSFLWRVWGTFAAKQTSHCKKSLLRREKLWIYFHLYIYKCIDLRRREGCLFLDPIFNSGQAHQPELSSELEAQGRTENFVIESITSLWSLARSFTVCWLVSW